MEDILKNLHQQLLDSGKVIEAGWISLRAVAISRDAPKTQLDEMRTAFFAGAQHLFASVMVGLDSDDEPTEQDLKRLDLIAAELQAFIDAYKAKHGLP